MMKKIICVVSATMLSLSANAMNQDDQRQGEVNQLIQDQMIGLDCEPDFMREVVEQPVVEQVAFLGQVVPWSIFVQDTVLQGHTWADFAASRPTLRDKTWEDFIEHYAASYAWEDFAAQNEELVGSRGIALGSKHCM